MTEYRIYIAKNCFEISDNDRLYKIVNSRWEAARCCDRHNSALTKNYEYYYFMKYEL